MKKHKAIILLLLGLMVVLGLSGASGKISLESGDTAPETGCKLDTLARERLYTAIAPVYGIGIYCGNNAKVLVYECAGKDCADATQVAEGYKVAGKLPRFTGLEVGAQYKYGCYECAKGTGACPLVVTEGETVEIEWSGTDPDKDIGPQGKLTYTFEGVFSEDGVWKTKKGDAGVHKVMATVFDGEFTDTTELCVEVLKGNEPPQLRVQSPVRVSEGETVDLKPLCTDPDEDKVTITYKGWMLKSTKSTGFNDAGEYSVEVTCQDPDLEKDVKKVKVIVEDVNRKPSLSVSDKTVTEGETVTLGAKCTDADGDDTSIEYKGFMTSDTKRTGFDDGGKHTVDVTCKDTKGASDTKKVTVTVLEKNRPPQITTRDEVTVFEGETVFLRPRCTDVDRDTTTITYSGWMTSASRKTGFDDAGDYDVTVTCTDSKGGRTNYPVEVHVLNRNRPPAISWRQR